MNVHLHELVQTLETQGVRTSKEVTYASVTKVTKERVEVVKPPLPHQLEPVTTDHVETTQDVFKNVMVIDANVILDLK